MLLPPRVTMRQTELVVRQVPESRLFPSKGMASTSIAPAREGVRSGHTRIRNHE